LFHLGAFFAGFLDQGFPFGFDIVQYFLLLFQSLLSFGIEGSGLKRVPVQQFTHINHTAFVQFGQMFGGGAFAAAWRAKKHYMVPLVYFHTLWNFLQFA